MIKTIVIIVTLALLPLNAQSQFTNRIKLLLSDEIPVEVSVSSVSRVYNSELEEYIFSTDYSITNRSDSFISQIAFIGYAIDKNGEIGGTSVWSERLPIAPNETRHFSKTSMFSDYENQIEIWSAHSVCMEFGTMNLELSGVKKSVEYYILGKQFSLPKAKGSLYPRCDPEDYK